MKDPKNNPHAGHRERLRRRFLKEGLENFEDHQKLELLLTYAIPRVDVNDLAHALMAHFGSFSAVLDATHDELTSVPGIGESAATFLTLLPQVARAYLMDKETRYPDFSDLHKLGTYLVSYYTAAKNEKLIAAFLNNRREMIDLVVLSEGTVNLSEVSLRRVAELALRKNVASFILAHNHPDGDAMPSEQDEQMTRHFADFFSKLGIPLAEHFVIGGNSYYGIYSSENSGRRLGILPGLYQNEK